MNCKKTRQYLLVDYLDGEIEETRKAKIDEHLLKCGGCRAFLSEVRNTSLSMHEGAEELPVPDDLWNKISGKITEQEQNRFGALLKNIWAKLTPPVWFVRGAFVPLLVLVAVVATNTIRSSNDLVYSYITEQVQFMDGFDFSDEIALDNDFDYEEILFSDVDF